VVSHTDSTNDDLKNLSLAELEHLLNEVLEQEDYIKAASIRDEIKARKTG
ncbi:MAG: UvrB/UvrC motif-containing protein, partial [Bacteroidota bacterium]|nr:UvrB/UvrC motif-containing protein [Bacteroidota bacterium]